MIVQTHCVLADKTAGEVRVTVFQGFYDLHVIDDRPSDPIVLAHGSTTDSVHVLEQAVRRLAQEGALRQFQDLLMKADVRVRIFLDLGPFRMMAVLFGKFSQ